MTPAERSNSPAIISSATGTAMIPTFEASSVQRAKPSSSANFAPAAQRKRKKTARTPTIEPISGRWKRRAARPTRARRSSRARTGSATCAIRSPFARWARPSAAPTEPAGLARAPPRVGGHLRGVRLLDVAGAGEHRLSAADGVEVVLVEVEEHDRQVALLELLLVDGEEHLAPLDRLDHVAREVERGDLRLRARAGRGVLRCHADLRIEREDGVDRLVRSELRLDLIRRRRDVRHALDLEPRRRAAEARLRPGVALLEADVPLLVDDHEKLLAAGRLELRAGALAGDRLGLAHVRHRAERLEGLDARVDRDDRDAGVPGSPQRVLQGARVRRRDDEAARLARDRGADQLGLLLRVVEALAVGDLDAQVLPRLQHALLDDRPERVAGPVRDDGVARSGLGRGGNPGGGSGCADRRAKERRPGRQEASLDQEVAA